MDNNLKWIFNNNTVNAAYFSNELIYPTNENVTVNVIGPLKGFEISLCDVVTYGDNNEYIELEYIESTGTLYIDTGFKPNNNTKVIMEAQSMGLLGTAVLQAYFGALNGDLDRYALSYYTTKNAYIMHFYDKNKSVDSDRLTNRIFVTMDGCTANVNGNLIMALDDTKFQNPLNLYLFAMNHTGEVKYFSKNRVYSCKIYDNGTIVRDFVPVISVNNIYGLFDKINNKFYSSATDDFIGGNVVKYVDMGNNTKCTRLEYIECVDTSHIDTKFIPNQDTRIVMKMLIDTPSGITGYYFGARTSATSNTFHFAESADAGFRSGYKTTNTLIDNTNLKNTIITVDKNKNITYINGTQVASVTYATFTCPVNLTIGVINNNGTIYSSGYFKIYSCLIYDNGVLVRDYIPALDENNIAGLYETLSDTFHPSCDTKQFVAGPKYVDKTVQTESTATYKIKRDTKYIVEAGDVEGYITPEKQSFTAKNYSRTVDVIYEELPVIDLSMFDIYGNPILLNTANCYVVNKANTYKIPLVFGNALKNGAVNSTAYTNNGGNYSHDFVDFNGTVVTSPYIENISGKADSAQLSIADTDGIFTNISIVDGSPCRYLQFKVNSVPDTGANGVLSIKNSNGFIMWSWHIWVWPYDLTPVEIVNNAGIGYNILPVNLATKLDTADSINKTTGWKNWFYQFGRPTPLLCPSSYTSTSNHASYGSLKFTSISIASNLPQGIMNPTTFYKHNASYNYNWFKTNSGKTYNLWDAACTSTGTSDNNVVKTIYDPCPIGFKMPNGNTFTEFSTSNVVGSFTDGYKFKRCPDDTVGVFFPASGYLEHSSGSLYDAGSGGYVWLSSAESQNNTNLLYFYLNGISPQSYNRRACGYSIRPVTDTDIQGQNKRTKIRIDQTITDPEAMITRIVDLGGIEAIRANSHRYTGTFADGKMTLKQLDDADGTKYADGTTATLSTVGIDVWMKLPQFHWKCSQYATDVWDFEVVYGVKPDDTYKTWDGNDLIGVYEAYNSSNKIYSISGVSSTGSINQTVLKTCAQAHGEGFSLVKWKHHCMMAMLYYTMYGNTNSQTKIGVGTGIIEKLTGATDTLGMTDTEYGNGGSHSINFWGLENWWGNKYEWLDNVTVDEMVWKVTEDDGTVRQAGTANSSGGYITKLLFGENIDLIPTAVGNDSSTGFCDYYHKSSGNSYAVVRSSHMGGPACGVAYVRASYEPSYSKEGVGSRIAFRGNIVIEN